MKNYCIGLKLELQRNLQETIMVIIVIIYKHTSMRKKGEANKNSTRILGFPKRILESLHSIQSYHFASTFNLSIFQSFGSFLRYYRISIIINTFVCSNQVQLHGNNMPVDKKNRHVFKIKLITNIISICINFYYISK